MRKTLILFIAILLVGVALRPNFTQAQESASWKCPAGFEGETLSVYNWSTYVAEDTISNFQELCGLNEVIYDVYGSNEEMLARIRQGNPGYDIVVPTDYTVAIMASEGLLEPLDLDEIPNFANVSKNLTGTPFDPENEYSIPYQWGTVGIGYNVDAVGEEVTSWSQLFEYDGPVAWLEDYRAMFGIALTLLGYNPNSEDLDEIAEARDFLIDNGNNVVAIAADDGQALLQAGNADIVVEYSGDIFQIMADCECDDFNYVIPTEGTVVWVDNLAIPVDAPNPDLAHAFIDYILDPQVGADISNYTAFSSPNQMAIDLGLIDEAYLNNPSIYPTDEVSQRLYFIVELPDVEQDYLDAWDEIVIVGAN